MDKLKLLTTRYAKWLILLSLLYFPIFGHLDSYVFRQWDEARQAMNAFEMSDNGNIIVTHYDAPPFLLAFCSLFNVIPNSSTQ